MANFAQLGIEIDSRQAEEAASDLDKLTQAGDRAEKSAEKTSRGWVKSLSEIERSSAKTATEVDRLSTAQVKAQQTSERIAESSRKSANSISSLQGQFAKYAEGSLASLERIISSSEAILSSLRSAATAQMTVADSAKEISKSTSLAVSDSERLSNALKNQEDVARVMAAERQKAAEFERENAAALKQTTTATTNWAAEQQKANARAREMEQADSRRAASAQKANSTIRDQQKELAALIGKIDPAVAALNRLDEQEHKLAGFRRQGLVDTETFNRYNTALQQQRQALSAVSDATGKAGLSTRAYAAAMRNVPAQITDIAVSLQAGQRPFTVLLQQGGQLKDMFGGIIPAAKALATGLAGLINPITIIGAAVATLAIGWKRGSDEAVAFNQALITSGRSSQITADNLSYLALEMDKIGGVTSSSAARALTEVAEAGVFTADQIGLVATAAETMRAATGKSVSETIAEFQKLRGDPVNAIIALNESYNFLDQSQLQSIRTLTEQGRQTEAITEAFRIYSEAINTRAPQVVSNLGLIERAYRGIKSAASEIVDSIANIGRPEDIQRLRALQSNIANINNGSSLYRGLTPEARANTLKKFQDEVAEIQRRLSARPVEVIMAGIYSPVSQREEEAKKVFDARERSLDTQKRRTYEIAQIQKEGVAAGKTQVEIDKTIAAYKKQQADIDAKKNRPKANSDQNSANTLLESAQRQIEANRQLAESGEPVSASQRQIIQINQRLADSTNKMTAATRAELIAARDLLAITDAQAKLSQQTIRDKAANLALTDRLTNLSSQQTQQNQIALMGIGRGGDAAAMLQSQLNIRKSYLDELEKLEKTQRNINTRLSQEEYEREKGLLQASLDDRLQRERDFQEQRMRMMGDWQNGFRAAYEDFSYQASNVAGATQGLFQNAFQGATDALISFVTTGKASFADLTQSILSDLAKILIQKQIVGLVGSIGGFGGNTGTIGSLFSGEWGFARGGYTGDGGKYQPKGIVHAGEVVWSQRDVKAVGGPRVANAMRPTAGYANGGIVGGGSSSMGGPQIKVQINNTGGNIGVESQRITRMPDNSWMLELKTFVQQAGAEAIATGAWDGPMASSFGNTRRGR